MTPHLRQAGAVRAPPALHRPLYDDHDGEAHDLPPGLSHSRGPHPLASTRLQPIGQRRD